MLLELPYKFLHAAGANFPVARLTAAALISDLDHAIAFKF